MGALGHGGNGKYPPSDKTAPKQNYPWLAEVIPGVIAPTLAAPVFRTTIHGDAACRNAAAPSRSHIPEN